MAYTTHAHRKRARKAGAFTASLAAAALTACALATLRLTFTARGSSPTASAPDGAAVRAGDGAGIVDGNDDSSGDDAAGQLRDPCYDAARAPRVEAQFEPFLEPMLMGVDGRTRPDESTPRNSRVFDVVLRREYLMQRENEYVRNVTSATELGFSYDLGVNPEIAELALRAFRHDDRLRVRELPRMYHHLNRMNGVKFVLDVDLEADGLPLAETHRDRVLIHRFLTGLCEVSVVPGPTPLELPVIHFIVPYSGRPKRMEAFLQQYHVLKTAEKQLHPIAMIVSAHGISVDEFRKQFTLAQNPALEISVVSDFDPNEEPSDFSRAVAIREGMHRLSMEDLAFIVDIDVRVHPMFLPACVSNTVRGSQVYFPVMYNLYPGESSIAKAAGYWRETSFGMSCMYRSDFEATGGYRHAEMRYRVFRSLEPGLRHVWHMKRCNPKSQHYTDCVEAAFKALGTSQRLGSFFLGKRNDLQLSFASLDPDWDGWGTSG